LIVDGDSKDDEYIHTVHRIMTDTDARFDWGTRQDAVTVGIEKYIHDAGYNCDVEYRGLDYEEGDPKKPADWKKPVAFSQDWLKDNDNPNKGFILLLVYCKYDQTSHTFTNAWNAGHAVTLVNAEPDMILIHDPAHYENEAGRKILTPQVLTGGSWQEAGMNATPVSGLLLLSGSLLEAPPDAEVMVSGAVCVTMLPADAPSGSPSTPVSGPNSNIAGSGTSGNPATPAVPAAPSTASKGWMVWLFDWLFDK